MYINVKLVYELWGQHAKYLPNHDIFKFMDSCDQTWRGSSFPDDFNHIITSPSLDEHPPSSHAEDVKAFFTKFIYSTSIWTFSSHKIRELFLYKQYMYIFLLWKEFFQLHKIWFDCKLVAIFRPIHFTTLQFC